MTLDLAADAVLLQLFFLPVPVLLAARGQQLLLDLDTAVHVPVLQLEIFYLPVSTSTEDGTTLVLRLSTNPSRISLVLYAVSLVP